MKKEQILVVDDDHKIGSMLKRALEYEGYAVHVALSGEDALMACMQNSFDLIILDIMLPGLSGWEVCQEIRNASPIPIIMLTAKDEVEERVKGLDLGADDYVVKPFALTELLARIRAQLRRNQPNREKASQLQVLGIELHRQSRTCFRNGRKIDLRGKEFDLLELFMDHPQIVLSKDQILHHIWGHDYEGESNVIEVYVASLRAKLEEKGEPRLIQTVRGLGYILREDA